MLDGTDAKILLVCMDALQKILAADSSAASFKNKMEKAGIVAALGKLMNLESDSVYEKAYELHGHFSESFGVDEDQNLRPNAGDDGFALKDVEWDGGLFDDVGTTVSAW